MQNMVPLSFRTVFEDFNIFAVSALCMWFFVSDSRSLRGQNIGIDVLHQNIYIEYMKGRSMVGNV